MRHTPRLISSLTILWLIAGCAHSDAKAVTSQNPLGTKGPGFAIPNAWTRRGLVLERPHKDSGVRGDPCIVWDDASPGWRMVLFYAPPGHAQAVCTNRDDPGPGQWKLEGPLPVTNPEAVGGFHKPFIVMDPD